MCIRDRERDEWYFATFLPFQPDLNYHNEEVKKEMFDTIRYWLAKGVDGFRLDIFNVIMKDPIFRNNPVSYTHLRAHETVLDIVCRLLLEKKH